MADKQIEVELSLKAEKAIAQARAAGKQIRKGMEPLESMDEERRKSIRREAMGSLVADAQAREKSKQQQAPSSGSAASSGSQAVPPKLPPWQRVGATGTMAMLNQWTQGGLQSPLAVAAQFGAALAGLRVVVGLVRYAFQSLIAPIKMASHFMLQQADEARKLYAKNLSSGGLGIGYVAKRSALAEILGVSERDVMQYGSAIAYLNERIEVSTTLFAKANPQLTTLSWEWKALMLDFQALGATIAAELAPALRTVLGIIREIVETVGENGNLKGRSAGAKTVGIGGAGNFTIPLWLFNKFSQNGPFSKGAPDVPVNTQRIQASTWEKMGLVIGGFGSQNPQQETAKNTRQMVGLLQRMLPGGEVPRSGRPMFGTEQSMP